MKYIIIFALSLISTSIFSQQSDTITFTNYMEWNGLGVSEDSQKSINASISYDGHDFRLEVEVELEDNKSILVDKVLRSNHVKHYNGVNGVINLRDKEGKLVYMIFKITARDGSNIHYLLAQDLTDKGDCRLLIKDTTLIDTIDSLMTKPITNQVGV